MPSLCSYQRHKLWKWKKIVLQSSIQTVRILLQIVIKRGKKHEAIISNNKHTIFWIKHVIKLFLPSGFVPFVPKRSEYMCYHNKCKLNKKLIFNRKTVQTLAFWHNILWINNKGEFKHFWLSDLLVLYYVLYCRYLLDNSSVLSFLGYYSQGQRHIP